MANASNAQGCVAHNLHLEYQNERLLQACFIDLVQHLDSHAMVDQSWISVSSSLVTECIVGLRVAQMAFASKASCLHKLSFILFDASTVNLQQPAFSLCTFCNWDQPWFDRVLYKHIFWIWKAVVHFVEPFNKR